MLDTSVYRIAVGLSIAGTAFVEVDSVRAQWRKKRQAAETPRAS